MLDSVASGKRYFIVIVLALSLACLFSIAALARATPDDLADKQSQVERVKNEISAINSSAEAAIERYNVISSELEVTNVQVTDNSIALDEASRRLVQTRYRVGKRLQTIYKDGSLGLVEVMLDTSSFNDFISRYDMLGRITDQDRMDLDLLVQYKQEIESIQSELSAAQAEQQQLLEDMAAEQAQIEESLAARKAVLSGVEGEIAELARQQAKEEEQAEWMAAAPVDPPPAETPADASPETAPAEESPPGEEPPADEGAADSEDDEQPGSDTEPPAADPPPAVYGDAASIARKYLGVPYVWGGASPSGFDCSGLVMYVYGQLGVFLPHSAAAQYYSGTPVEYSQLQPGDLVFFGSPINHVGIYIGGGSMIHAPFEGEVVSIATVGGGGSYSGACRL